MTGWAPLVSTEDVTSYGGKSVSLGRALRAGLPVPDGFALSVGLLDGVVHDHPGARATLAEVFARLGGAAAARSSAVGEDAKDASFAGQHTTILNVTSFDGLLRAVREVHTSAHASSALAYRQRLGIEGSPRIAIALQRLVDATAAGVLFTRNPATGAEERVVEAAWGLGEVVVSGMVVPDFCRLSPDGALLAYEVGEKDVALRRAGGGGTEPVELDGEQVHGRVLDDEALAALQGLACDCERVYGRDLDIEWAIAGDALYLLQCRSITTAAV